MKKRLFLGLLFVTLVLGVCLSSASVAHAASKQVHAQANAQRASLPNNPLVAAGDCFGPVVLTIGANGTQFCWYQSGYHGVAWNQLTYFHADTAPPTRGWFRIYFGGVGCFQNFYPGDTWYFGGSVGITQICLECAPHSGGLC